MSRLLTREQRRALELERLRRSRDPLRQYAHQLAVRDTEKQREEADARRYAAIAKRLAKSAT